MVCESEKSIKSLARVVQTALLSEVVGRLNITKEPVAWTSCQPRRGHIAAARGIACDSR